jgi:hypothetical protein
MILRQAVGHIRAVTDAADEVSLGNKLVENVQNGISRDFQLGGENPCRR